MPFCGFLGLNLQIPVPPRNLSPIPLQFRHPKPAMQRLRRSTPSSAKGNQQYEGDNQSWSKPRDVERIREDRWKCGQFQTQHKASPYRGVRYTPREVLIQEKKSCNGPQKSHVYILLLSVLRLRGRGIRS